jgi:hypothetical protein
MATEEYRLDVVTDPDPDTPLHTEYLTATDVDAAAQQAQRLLAAVDGPEDRYGELYVHNGNGGAAYVDTIHLPA